jgi:hypothetical protein
MGWKRNWSERKPRPVVKALSKKRKNEILSILVGGIESSPVLSSLNIRARALRGRFYIEEFWKNDSDEELESAFIGRITPLVTPRGRLLLEAEKSKGNWYEVKKGNAKTLIAHIANDTKGTFHGLGTLNRSLCEAGGDQRLPVKMDEDLNFTYKNTGGKCSTQETLYHFFDLPISVIAEPSGWYIYHRKPVIAEVSHDRKSVLVRFTSMNKYGSAFGGTCLYSKVNGDKWDAYTIKPNQSKNIKTSISWLEKRKWVSW